MKELLTLATTIAALFSITFLRGLQNKSVAAGHKRMAFIGGTVMSACELFVVGLVATSENTYFMLIGAVGSGIGWVAGMVLHERLMRKKMALLKAEKKSKRARRIRTASRDEINKVLEERGLI